MPTRGRTKISEYKGLSTYSNYYKVKPVTDVYNTNDSIDPNKTALVRMKAMYQWVLDNPNKCVRANKLEILDNLRTVSVFSGHHVIKGTEFLKEFEWCHKNIQN